MKFYLISTLLTLIICHSAEKEGIDIYAGLKNGKIDIFAKPEYESLPVVHKIINENNVTLYALTGSSEGFTGRGYAMIKGEDSCIVYINEFKNGKKSGEYLVWDCFHNILIARGAYSDNKRSGRYTAWNKVTKEKAAEVIIGLNEIPIGGWEYYKIGNRVYIDMKYKDSRATGYTIFDTFGNCDEGIAYYYEGELVKCIKASLYHLRKKLHY